MKRSGRIAARSQRALDALPERARVVDAAWERDRGTCRVVVLVREHLMGRLHATDNLDEIMASLRAIRCGGPLDPHEVIPRSAWAAGYLVLHNVVMICRNHHDWVGDYPDAAHEVGLHGYSWERVRCEECGEPWGDGGQCRRCGNRTWVRS